MVCCHGGGAQNVRAGAYLCRFKALKDVHPLLAIDETLAQLARVAVFSKLDANSRFGQIPLAATLCIKTSDDLHYTFWLVRMYCFTKLPFGINSAPEENECNCQWSSGSVVFNT